MVDNGRVSFSNPVRARRLHRLASCRAPSAAHTPRAHRRAHRRKAGGQAWPMAPVRHHCYPVACPPARSAVPPHGRAAAWCVCVCVCVCVGVCIWVDVGVWVY